MVGPQASVSNALTGWIVLHLVQDAHWLQWLGLTDAQQVLKVDKSALISVTDILWLLWWLSDLAQVLEADEFAFIPVANILWLLWWLSDLTQVL